MIYKTFYSELGKLLYAIADIDGVISRQEKDLLLDTVKNELAPAEQHRDEFKTNVAYYTEFEFDFLDEHLTNPQVTFMSFLDFIDEHQSAFDDKLKKACLVLAKELAAVYRGTNKKEKEFIRQLEKKIDGLNKRQVVYEYLK